MTDYVSRKTSAAAAPAERGSMPGSSSDPGRAASLLPGASRTPGIGLGVRGIDLDIGPGRCSLYSVGAMSTRELVESVWLGRGDLATDPGWEPGSPLRAPLVKVDPKEWRVEDILDNLGWDGDLDMMDPHDGSEWLDFDGQPD
jgi:hypothetical protein